MKSLIFKISGAFGCLVAVVPDFANIPGGGTGTGCARHRTSGSFSENARFLWRKDL
jgi:hypothetical protein